MCCNRVLERNAHTESIITLQKSLLERTRRKITSGQHHGHVGLKLVLYVWNQNVREPPRLLKPENLSPVKWKTKTNFRLLRFLLNEQKKLVLKELIAATYSPAPRTSFPALDSICLKMCAGCS